MKVCSRVSKETKFGYGFLFAGSGVPYLVEKLGPTAALTAAALFVLVGVVLLIAGHLHRDAAEGEVVHVSRTVTSVIVALVAILGVLVSMWFLVGRKLYDFAEVGPPPPVAVPMRPPVIYETLSPSGSKIPSLDTEVRRRHAVLDRLRDEYIISQTAVPVDIL